MAPTAVEFFRPMSIAIVALLAASVALAQETPPDQVLDQVDAFNANVVLEMAFDDPNRTADYSELLGSGDKTFAACKLGVNGLYCLETDGAGEQVVRYWKEPQSLPNVSTALVNCSDATLGLDGPQPCVGMTVDLFGAIWLAGRKAGPKYSLIKIVDKAKITQGCTTGAWTALAGNANLCANEYVANRPLFTDLDSIDGDVAEAFDDFGSGVLAVENGTSTVFFPDVDDASPNPDPNFGSWGLASGEKLLSTSLLQVPVGPETTEVTNYILAVTNTGRVLSKAALAPAATQQVLDLTPSSPIEIDQASWTASSCLDAQTCNVAAATLTAAGGTNPTLVQKLVNGAYGLGVRGGAAGDEIGADEQLGVQFPDGSTVTAIKVLFLYNGDEFGDFREQATIKTIDQGTAVQHVYTLTAKGENFPLWNGSGTVESCGDTTISGTGCFLIRNPFPTGVPIHSLSFTASGDPSSDFGIGSIEADVVAGAFAIRTSFKTGLAYISDRDGKTVRAFAPNAGPAAFTTLTPVNITRKDPTTGAITTSPFLTTAPHEPDGLTVAPGIFIDLAQCTVNCALITTPNGVVAASLNNVHVTAGPTGMRMFEVRNIPDCRYVPQVCRLLLNGGEPVGGVPTPVPDDVARQQLITAGWILPLDTANKLKPAAELLNVTPLLPLDVTSQFDSSGVAPNGLPPLYVSRQYRGQVSNGHLFNGLFFKTAAGIRFEDTFGGEIDVFALTGRELGCEQPELLPPTDPDYVPFPTIADRLKWDVITTVSETYISVGGRYIDTITNVGCRNPTKISGGRLSFVPYNLEPAWDTFGHTIKSFTPRVTINNDAVFARLTQSLWDDIGTSRRDLVCKQVDTLPIGGAAPFSSATCKTLASIWSIAKLKLDLCVIAAFFPRTSAGTSLCNLARRYVVDYRNAVPATAAGPDTANRRGAHIAHLESFLHVFDTRFRPSIKPNGYCREWGTCATP